MTDPGARVDIIIIGRNEGDRLLASLASLTDDIRRIVYVDSGSTDGSVQAAADHGAVVVALDKDTPFTAARARNSGFAALDRDDPPKFVQFIDGDCALDAGWISRAADFLRQNPNVAVVCGRRRERFPEVSVYNRMCDEEWDTPLGERHTCGGDALMRWEAFDAVGGFDPTLIAGEEPELCLRLRKAGWKIWRLDAEMTLHDAAIVQFGQFWKRARRAGHATAEGMAMYGSKTERLPVTETLRSLLWGVAIPAVVIIGFFVFGPTALWLLLIYPAQVTKLAARAGWGQFAWKRAVLLTVGKFAECRGILDYVWGRWRGRKAKLIEYK